MLRRSPVVIHPNASRDGMGRIAGGRRWSTNSIDKEQGRYVRGPRESIVSNSGRI
ncbi:MAG: hypothetical protein QOG15_421 [Solirubrobacteraceae bacterium]|nr:hypothetical protein [Solirubrobacteraceae bacterium]